jgi:hypothetical protein
MVPGVAEAEVVAGAVITAATKKVPFKILFSKEYEVP